ncbi:XEG113 [Scenedesmus sp. PABB004]|nr:XEG113 [Scenedesmus sp. PABB004]
MTKPGAPHHHAHHRQHPGSGSGCAGWRRRNYVLVLGVLVGVLVVNMLLLMPQLHASDSWRLVGFTSHGGGATTGASSGAPASGRGGGSSGRGAGGVGGRGAASADGDFVGAHDADHDGVLGRAEFDALVQEACLNDRASLPLLRRAVRFVRLALGRPPGARRGGYPCTLRGELADTARRAAAALTGWGRRSGGGGGGSGGSGGAAGGAAREGAAAAQQQHAAALDPDSPEGKAAARAAALLAGCSPLTPELAAAAVRGGTTLLVAAADWSMFEVFGVNWLAHVQRAGGANYLLAALDQRTADFMRNNRLGRCVTWSAGAGPAAGGAGPLPQQAPPYEPGSAAHRAASWAKLGVSSVLLGWGYDVVASDLDVVWRADPGPALAGLPRAADVVIASDAPAPRHELAAHAPGLLTAPGAAGGALNPGVALLRATPPARALLAEWLAAAARAEEDGGDAAAAGPGGAGAESPGFPTPVLRAWLAGQRARAAPHPAAPGVLQLPAPRRGGLLGGLRPRRAGLGVFSQLAVANSYAWAVQRVGGAPGARRAAGGGALPLAVHFSRGGASLEARLHRMREAQWYADGPRYYSEPGLMSFALSRYAGPALLAGAAPGARPGALLALHVASLAHELSQFYAAAAVAAALGRVLVLPAFTCWCYADPDGGPGGPPPRLVSEAGAAGGWSCRAPGDASSALPFNCSLDAVLAPAALYAHAPLFAGRPLNFREAGFLHHPRTPSWVRHAATAVRSGDPAGCEPGPGGAPGRCAQALPGKPPPGTNQQVVVPRGLTDGELAALLAPWGGSKHLRFDDVAEVWGGFDSPVAAAEYDAWLAGAVRPWCCKPGPPSGPGEAASALPGWTYVNLTARPPPGSAAAAGGGASGAAAAAGPAAAAGRR